MNLKDVSISSEFNEIQQAVMSRQSLHPQLPQSDVFLIVDFEENIGKSVELQRNSDGEFFRGILESVKIDIEPFNVEHLGEAMYLIKIQGYDHVFEIAAESIDYNPNYTKKYYFKVNNLPVWRIVFN